ncbi:hypothetical protein FisN_26Hu142 [Fistulifera solaris]|uniref:Uncharacterized protein n=1 Tax=Fistulifera solaris TaxID=1519565 RepID=A0A1Z5JXU7_FISSO|nr:hypothetical protein FisN_26Hu142 [Fistulifera solaris]|eukprot:GAX18840.1 hypothetical protein FisN_26Hu142 [Fistulifera solaris]
MDENEAFGPLLSLIPPHLRTPEQKAHWSGRDNPLDSPPTYTLLRNPRNLSELNAHNRLAIWRESNSTLTYVMPRGERPFPQHHRCYLLLQFCDIDLCLDIVGPTTCDIAETAAFFLSLQGASEGALKVESDCNSHCYFKYCPDHSHFLEPMLELSPTRHVTLKNMKLNAQQSTILATRPYPVQLTLAGEDFFDDGEISSSALAEANTFDIKAKKLSLTIQKEGLSFPIDGMNSLMRHVAKVDHLKELKLYLIIQSEGDREPVFVPDCFVEELMKAVFANPHLQVLDVDMHTSCDLVDWKPHMECLLQALKDHKGLRTLKISVFDFDFGSNFQLLREFLSAKRDATVLDRRFYGRIIRGRVVCVQSLLSGFTKTCRGATIGPIVAGSNCLDASCLARWDEGGEAPTYKLQRDPVELEEFKQYNHGVVIWRENDTLTFIAPYNNDSYASDDSLRSLSLEFYALHLTLHIVGETEAAVTETAEYFLSFETLTDEPSTLEVSGDSFGVNLSTISALCFKRMLEMDPLRVLEFQQVTFSAEQSMLLATYATRLRLEQCMFEDEGTAFVDALESRQSAFSLLRMEGAIPFNEDNLKRLFEVEVIDRLDFPYNEGNEISCQVFSAKVNSLVLYIYFTPSMVIDLASVNITAKKLTLDLDVEDCETFPAEPILSLFRRFSAFKHFEEIRIDMSVSDFDTEIIPSCVAYALANVIVFNTDLQILELNGHTNWDEHVATLLHALKHHKGIRALELRIFDEDIAFGVDFIHLRELLFCNRDITVFDGGGEIITDGCFIDALYSLNRFFRGSEGLVVEAAVSRVLLVPTALAEAASNDFQKSALLLAHHVDVLFELIQVALLYEVEEADDQLGSSSRRSSKLRREIFRDWFRFATFRPKSQRMLCIVLVIMAENENHGASFDAASVHRVRWRVGRGSRLLEFRHLFQKPASLEELNGYEQMMYRRDNGAITYILPGTQFYNFPKSNDTFLPLKFSDKGPRLLISCDSDDAVSKTVEFFMSLLDPMKHYVQIGETGYYFNVCCLQTCCLMRIIDAAQSLHVRFQSTTLSVSQAVALAKGPHPARLTFDECYFPDGGTTFVDALLDRLSPFHSFALKRCEGFSDGNMGRLFESGMIDHLTLPSLDPHLCLYAFSAKVKSLEFDVPSAILPFAIARSFDMSATQLSLTIRHIGHSFPTEVTHSWWRRMAHNNQMTKLKVGLIFVVDRFHEKIQVPDSVVVEILRAVVANCNLQLLDLCTFFGFLNWASHLTTFFEYIKHHKSLHTFGINVYESDFGPNFSLLRQLLTENRNITVIDQYGCPYTDGRSIDQLYSLNRFFRGSACLAVEPSLDRLSLVATALIESVSRNYQRSALLLANHADVLCELVPFVEMDED